MVVVCPFLYSNSNFGIVKFTNYGCIQTGFVKLKVEVHVFCCIFKYVSCLYHLRSPSRETIGDVSIGTWAEKGLSN